MRDDIGAAALPYTECIQPIGIFSVVFLKDGSIKALPSLPPVIQNCLYDSFIFVAIVWIAALLRNLARESAAPMQTSVASAIMRAIVPEYTQSAAREGGVPPRLEMERAFCR